jgi:hypothetical protein
LKLTLQLATKGADRNAPRAQSRNGAHWRCCISCCNTTSAVEQAEKWGEGFAAGRLQRGFHITTCVFYHRGLVEAALFRVKPFPTVDFRSISRHLTDGEIGFTLIQYDEGTESAESKAAGDGPCIHHFAVEVEDMEKSKSEILSHGCEIISDPGVIPIKFRAPGGTVAELVPVGRYKKPARPVK